MLARVSPSWLRAGPAISGVCWCFSVGGFAEWNKEAAEVEGEEEEDDQEVFTVELHRGPHGLGLALVDGMVRPSDLLPPVRP